MFVVHGQHVVLAQLVRAVRRALLPVGRAGGVPDGLVAAARPRVLRRLKLDLGLIRRGARREALRDHGRRARAGGHKRDDVHADVPVRLAQPGLDRLVDHLLLGLVDLVGAVRRNVHRPNFARKNDSAGDHRQLHRAHRVFVLLAHHVREFRNQNAARRRARARRARRRGLEKRRRGLRETRVRRRRAEQRRRFGARERRLLRAFLPRARRPALRRASAVRRSNGASDDLVRRGHRAVLHHFI
mmetsp:Transcript_1660/g.6615  ORF Transcript_1660/g.6615 Transcript_1660/m.6615 type:complete len:243 (-) Transcript_1660:351-1079(-)